jgi:hypothetical protein
MIESMLRIADFEGDFERGRVFSYFKVKVKR